MVATTLILFSLLRNMLAVGTVILFLHDISDVATWITRIYADIKFSHIIADVTLFIFAAVAWLYIRLMVFPFCVIREVYDSLPTAGS